MRLIRQAFAAASAVAAMLCCSCQQSAVAGPGVGVRNYSDAVVHISQVDPAYRAYFRAQDASNYSLSDQRKAYLAAAETARTPVREADYRPGDIRKRTVAKNNKSSARGSKASGAKGKSALAAKKKPAVKKRAVAVRKPTNYRRR